MKNVIAGASILSYKNTLGVLAKDYWHCQSAYVGSKLLCNDVQSEADQYIQTHNPDLWERMQTAKRLQTISKDAAESARVAMLKEADNAVNEYPQRADYEQFLPQGLDVKAETTVVVPIAGDPEKAGQVVEWMYKNGMKDNVTFNFRGMLDIIRHFKKTGLLPKDNLGNLIELETGPKVTVKAFERWEEYQTSPLNDGFDERGRIPDETTATPENLMFRHPTTRAFLFKENDVVSITPVTIEADGLGVTEGKVAFTSNQIMFVSKNGDRNVMAIDELYEALVEGDVIVKRHES